MKDKNGIEICWNNCHHKTAQNGCGITECDCDINDNKRCSFVPSKQAYEARIAELESRKPRAKKLIWEMPIYTLYKASMGDNISIYIDERRKENKYVVLGCDEQSVFSTLNEAKQAAQEWLDKLVEDCAEYDDKNQQKQVPMFTKDELNSLLITLQIFAKDYDRKYSPMGETIIAKCQAALKGVVCE